MPLAGRRIVRVRRRLDETGTESTTGATIHTDAGEGPLELVFDDGSALHVEADRERSSLVVAPGELDLAAGALTDLSRNTFWRWRLRRPITAVHVWKSLDVPPSAAELEFGIAIELGATPGFVIEFFNDGGLERLVVSDGRSAERRRTIRLG